MRAGRCILLLVMFAAGAWAAPTSNRARQLMETGLAHERQGQHEIALKEFTQALESRGLSKPDRVRAMFDQGVVLDALGRTRSAITAYTAALGLQRDFAPALNNRANAHRRLGQIEAAKRDYLAALKCKGVAREYPYYGLGSIAERVGDLETARDFYQKALAANPAFALAAQSLGGLHAPIKAAAPIITQQSPATPSAQAAPVLTGPPQKKAAAAPDAHLALRQAIVERPPATVGRESQVQLGAYGNEAMAKQAWGRFMETGIPGLEGRQPLIVPVDLPGKGRLWRLRTTLPDATAARSLCADLARRGLNCFIVRT